MRSKKTSNICEICDRDQLLFRCKYCGKVYCDEHRYPQKHKCSGITKYYHEQANGVNKPGVSDREFDENSYKSRVSTVIIEGLILAFKLLSVIVIVVTLLFIMILLIGFIQTNVKSLSYPIPVTNSTNAQVVLVNNLSASDVTYSELVAFLNADATGSIPYVYPNMTCADFARKLHDNAEAHGIRAAFVAIDFDTTAVIDYSVYGDSTGSVNGLNQGADTGHGLNLFNTTDLGPVYVDSSSVYQGSSGDRIAYVATGKEFNEIDLYRADSVSYSFYETYRQKYLNYVRDLRDYNSKVNEYNTEVNSYNGGFIPVNRRAALNQTLAELTAQQTALDTRKAELGPFYYPPGIVRSISVYW